MILPIYLYNQPVLRKDAIDVKIGANVSRLINDMFETMHNAGGCGLAATQVGHGVKIFVVSFAEEDGPLYERAFINPQIKINDGEACSFTEGCLSIPNVGVPVDRVEDITITYFDQYWNKYTEDHTGFLARIILHEHDHLISKLITDYAEGDMKKYVEAELKKIDNGEIEINYPIYGKNRSVAKSAILKL